MNLPRPARLLAPVALASVLSFVACKPTNNNFDAGCNQTYFGAPDGSVTPTGTWAGSCDSTSLQTRLNQLFADAGACSQDSDCSFFNDAGPFTVDCWQQGGSNPINIANAAGLVGALQGVIGSFCTQCDGGTFNVLGPGTPYPENQLCLQCFEGQCVANPLDEDAGS